MKLFITSILFLNLSFINAQNDDQFVMNFTQFSKILDGIEQEIEEGYATIVFNYGKNNNIKIYFPSGKSIFLSRVSDISDETTKQGTEFQYSKLLDEKGTEYLLAKYESGAVKLLYIKSFEETKGYGIIFYP